MHKLLMTMVWVIVGLVLLSACQPATPSPTAAAIPTVTPTPKPIAPEGLYPPDTRTGIPEIDVVLEAVADEDFGVLKNLVDPTEVPCQTQHYDLPGGPHCPEGVQKGTPVEAFPRGQCEGGDWAPIEDTQYFFNYLQAERSPLYVYTVYRSQRSIEGIRPVAYEIVLANSIHEEEPVNLFLDAEGRIIRFDFECSLESVDVEEIDFILPPLPLPPPPTPTPIPILEHGAPEGLYSPETRTGIPEVDVVLEAVATQDVDTLKNLVALTAIPCTTQRFGIPTGPQCPEGVEEGTPIQEFIDGGCEPAYITDLEFVRQHFDFYAAGLPLYVYAVYLPTRFLEAAPPVAYEILFAPSLEGPGQTVLLDPAGKIIGSFSCGGPSGMLPREASLVLPPDTGSVSADNLATYLSYEVFLMDRRLSAALGRHLPAYDFSSLSNEAFVHIVKETIKYCQELHPESFRQLPGFDRERHEEHLRGLESACGVLLSAHLALGEPQKNDEWGLAVLRASAALYDEPLPSPESVEGYLAVEADTMLLWLRATLGEEDVPFECDCVKETFVENVRGLIEYCQNLDLAYWRLLLGIDGPTRSQILEVLEQACGILKSAQSTLGVPRENEEWRAAVLEAKEILIRAGVPQE